MSHSPEHGEARWATTRPDESEVDVLVGRARNGETAAFDALVRLFSMPMYNLAYRMSNNREDADDLTQEVFVRLHRAIGQFRGESKFSTWLYTLALNTCRSGLRRVRRIGAREVVRLDAERDDDHPAPFEAVDPGDSPGKVMEREEVLRQVEAAVAELPEEFRAVIVLRDLQGLSYEEMADALRCSLGTVKSRLARARLRVKDKLIKEGVR